MDLWKFSAQPSKRDSKLGADFFLKKLLKCIFGGLKLQLGGQEFQKENRTFSRSDHCNDPFPNHKLHIQIIIIWCYHYYSKQLFAKKRECLLKNIPKINEKPIFSVFSETLIPQFVKADKYLDMIFRTSFYTSMID